MKEIAKLPLDFTLLTERLLIRRLRESDAGEIKTASEQTMPMLEEWMRTPATFNNLQHILGFIAEGTLLALHGKEYRFGAFDKKTGAFILSIDLVNLGGGRADTWYIGYWCAKPHQNKGFCKEVVHKITHTIFETLGAKRCALQCGPENNPSQHVAKACGFTLEGTLKNAYRNAKGEIQDSMSFSHTPETWADFKAKHGA